MRITQIAVQKLFGAFDHVIPLNRETDITIVIGENGLGKTVMLEATNAFFGKNYAFFRELEFERITFTFSTDEYWEITKQKDPKHSSHLLQVDRKFLNDEARLTIEREERSKRDTKVKAKPVKTQTYVRIPLTNVDKKESNQRREEIFLAKRRYIEHFMNRHDLARVDYEMPQWLLDEPYRYEDFFLPHGTKRNEIPAWFSEHKLDVRLIETQRIITAKERGGESYVSTVQKCADELITQISNIETSASDIAVALDSTYPSRLVQSLRGRRNHNEADLSELHNRLSALNSKRQLFSSAGLIESSGTNDFGFNEDTDAAQQSDLIYPLALYVDDSYKKLSPYEDLAKRINLFMEIVNKRFKHKTLEVNRKQGLVFRSTVKKDESGGFVSIPPKKLSSGEQNELILFYELIFKSNSGDMILIDEPELSLHISWQNKFIKDLKDVTSMNNVSIIIATHSPDIIDENWDLRVELKGLE